MGTPNRPFRFTDDVSAVRLQPGLSQRFVFNQETYYIEVFAEAQAMLLFGDGDGTVAITAYDGDDVDRLPVGHWEGYILNDNQGHGARKADMALRAPGPVRVKVREWYNTVRDGGAAGEPYAP